MSALASQWLIDTFAYTGVLIALVLLLRRPVARMFGPAVAYALWALVLLRFIMPPLVLPSSMAPAGPAPVTTGAQSALVVLTDPHPARADAAVMQMTEAGIALADGLFAVWLIGALGFLIWRGCDYARMRRELLAQARPVGESGKVRLVETPGVTSPVAFGIGDQVVALPPGFMAHHDREARDLAIAHELAHHRGRDLLANILAQPVLALHWFNPLAWWGWRAMRRDQEAACDARVMAGRSKSERAAYAQLIAGFAAGDNLALAAPMACPVLGEKSIIHRLRSLAMTEIPTRRRRLGMAILATSALVLPATASITYAQGEAPQAPPQALAQALPQALPQAPPQALPQAPDASDPSAPPAPSIIESVEPDRPLGRHGSDTDDQTRAGTMRLEAEFAQIEADLVRDRAQAQAKPARADAEMIRARAETASAHAIMINSAAPQVSLALNCDSENAAFDHDPGHGLRAAAMCQNAMKDATIMGLHVAMGALSRDRSIPSDARAEALRELQEAIQNLEAASRQIAAGAISSAPSGSTAYLRAQRIKVSAQIRFAPRSPLRSAPASDCNADTIALQQTGLTV